MRPPKKLFRILLRYVRWRREFKGLCDSVIVLYREGKISVIERMFLETYIMNHAPIKGKIGFWWRAKLRKPRVEWLKREIAKIEANEMKNLTWYQWVYIAGAIVIIVLGLILLFK